MTSMYTDFTLIVFASFGVGAVVGYIIGVGVGYDSARHRNGS